MSAYTGVLNSNDKMYFLTAIIRIKQRNRAKLSVTKFAVASNNQHYRNSNETPVTFQILKITKSSKISPGKPNLISFKAMEPQQIALIDANILQLIRETHASTLFLKTLECRKILGDADLDKLVIVLRIYGPLKTE